MNELEQTMIDLAMSAAAQAEAAQAAPDPIGQSRESLLETARSLGMKAARARRCHDESLAMSHREYFARFRSHWRKQIDPSALEQAFGEGYREESGAAVRTFQAFR